MDDATRLLVIADHLHEHCECAPCTTGERRCRACDLRALLREAREALLAWQAAGRRISRHVADALDNGRSNLERRAPECDTCAELATRR